MSSKICKNCPIYNIKERVCGVNVIKNGEFLELMTNPEDECFWIKNGIEIDQIKVDYQNNKRIIID